MRCPLKKNKKRPTETTDGQAFLRQIADRALCHMQSLHGRLTCRDLKRKLALLAGIDFNSLRAILLVSSTCFSKPCINLLTTRSGLAQTREAHCRSNQQKRERTAVNNAPRYPYLVVSVLLNPYPDGQLLVSFLLSPPRKLQYKPSPLRNPSQRSWNIRPIKPKVWTILHTSKQGTWLVGYASRNLRNVPTKRPATEVRRITLNVGIIKRRVWTILTNLLDLASKQVAWSYVTHLGICTRPHKTPRRRSQIGEAERPPQKAKYVDRSNKSLRTNRASKQLTWLDFTNPAICTIYQ
jgi:hypothetical protein